MKTRHYFPAALLTLIASCGASQGGCTPPPAPEPAVVVTGETLQIGTSWLGRPIVAERYGDGGPVIVVVSQIHGNEDAPLVVADAVRAHGWQGNTVWLVPTLNPDGAAAHVRTNGAGVDLNRDGGLTQPESQALLNLIQQVNPSLIVHVHSPSYYVGFYGSSWARGVATQVAAATNMPMRGYVANHPFLWVGTGGENLLVEVPAISAYDCGTCWDNRVQSTPEIVRGMSDAMMDTLDGAL